MEYTASKIYQRTLGASGEQADVIKRLRDAYEATRETMTEILKNIIADFPNLTIHDISHVDSLWGVADVIVGDDYPLSPLEGFILGCAFLIHDSALSYEAVGGVDKLRNLAYWKDTYTELLGNESMSDEEKLKEADFATIRYIHAQEAEKIIQREYQDAKGKVFYILDDSELRNHYGDIIGKIAASHHWNIEEVESLPTQFNVTHEFPREWRVNPMKLACILRCADAGHIDTGRAPDRLYNVLRLHGVSEQHWNAQNHLAVIDVCQDQKDKAIITSTHPFKEKDFRAWNVAFDAVRLLDRELKSSNRILYVRSSHDGGAFAIHSIAGVRSKEELAKYIQTEGWEPFEANLHIDDVGGVISKLGGEALYGRGDKMLTALREMIQNARDAIRARYIIEPEFTGSGKIDVHIYQKEGDTYVSVTDNGVGMSENVIKNCFLNFGCSLWNSSMLRTEYSGLRSSGFRAVGKFGIGFYSVFMVAASAEVLTRVYNKGTDTALELKFPDGLTLTPIKKSVDSKSTAFSTRITLKIDPKSYQWSEVYKINRNVQNESSFTTRFENALKALCAGLDVDVWYHENEQPARRIHRDITAADLDKKQWLRDISFADDQHNPKVDQMIEEASGRLEYIVKDGYVCGLAAINIRSTFKQDFLSITTVGGLTCPGHIHARGSEHYIGYMDTTPSSANREGDPPMKVYGEQITQWAQRQYDQVKSTLSIENKILIPYAISGFKVDTSDVCVLRIFTKKRLVQNISIKDCIDKMINEDARLAIVLSGFIRGEKRHIDTYITLSNIYPQLEDRDIWIMPIHNSGFLSVSSTEDYTLYAFIQRVAMEMGVELERDILENFLFTILGPSDMMYLTVKKH